MSKEKMYAVKNDEGKYWDFEDQDGFWELNTMNLAAIAGEEVAECVARDRGGHVVAFVEEPEKEAVSENEGKAIDSLISAETYVQASEAFQYLFASRKKEDIKRIMKAVRNGYTVAKEKKYNVKVPHAVNSYFKKIGVDYCIAGYKHTVDLDENVAQFTESEIAHYGLQDCEKEEVTDDEQ
ncbi:DUF1642 domain-containing protein [Lacticaseibacillus paracasei]|uniref:DUF1642 domain-containing protein n=1 Tax=Lacticaseibacillus paracasei TaxID=1597 RepID=UPI0023620A71|nr:DUF1642 domain-containing protein [Lacticaseibacillus paracasei]